VRRLRGIRRWGEEPTRASSRSQAAGAERRKKLGSRMPASRRRPHVLELGIALLALHHLVVLGACALAGVAGSAVLVLAAQGVRAEGGGVLLAVIAIAAAAFLLALMSFGLLSLAACVLAWRGSRAAVRAVVALSLLSSVTAPSPLAVLAAVFCTIGGLDHLELGGRQRRITAGAGEPDEEPPVAGD
jgi:hypothetical protein